MASTSLHGPQTSHFVKLTKSNYLPWLRQINPYLVGHALCKFIDGSHPLPSLIPDPNHKAKEDEPIPQIPNLAYATWTQLVARIPNVSQGELDVYVVNPANPITMSVDLPKTTQQLTYSVLYFTKTATLHGPNYTRSIDIYINGQKQYTVTPNFDKYKVIPVYPMMVAGPTINVTMAIGSTDSTLLQ
ncbi:hypothetical protein EV1_040831 [Malus domestica]